MSNIIYLSVVISFLINVVNQKNLIYNKRKLNFENIITLKIKGTGKIFICYKKPDEVYLDGKKINVIKENEYYVRINNTNNINIIIIKFNRNFSSLDYFFYSQYDKADSFLSIDLSKFDTSQVESI